MTIMGYINFVDVANGSLYVSFVELCVSKGVQMYNNNQVFVNKSDSWRI